MLMSSVICQTNWNTSFDVVFSPLLSVTHDKQRDRNHPYSSSCSAGRIHVSR